MRFLDDRDVAELVSPTAARDAVRQAFAAFADGRASVQRRERTAAGAAKLSTLGAVIPDAGVLGAKVYSTVAGRFCFVVVLFAGDDGRRLAVLESDALTRLRTAATSVIATEALRAEPPRRLVVLGSGAQATGHVEAFADRFELAEVVIAGRSSPDGVAARLAELTGVPVVAARLDRAEDVIAGADVVVTATRAEQPVLHGDWLAPGAHVCAVGSSRPDAAELDRSVYARARTVAVEWVGQARDEAGGLVDAVAAGTVAWDDVAELGPLIIGRPAPSTERAGDVTVFQSVGIGLEDVAVAAVAWAAAQARDEGRRSTGDPGSRR